MLSQNIDRTTRRCRATVRRSATSKDAQYNKVILVRALFSKKFAHLFRLNQNGANYIWTITIRSFLLASLFLDWWFPDTFFFRMAQSTVACFLLGIDVKLALPQFSWTTLLEAALKSYYVDFLISLLQICQQWSYRVSWTCLSQNFPKKMHYASFVTLLRCVKSKG